MHDTRHRQYLEAMGIETWSLRAAVQQAADPESTDIPVVTGVRLGPGEAGILMICASDGEPASRLANDITRAMGSVPVWAWPDAGAECLPLRDAVEERLFTTVAVLGTGLAASLFGSETPASVGSANLVLLPSLEELREQAGARQKLWDALCRAGMVSVAAQ